MKLNIFVCGKEEVNIDCLKEVMLSHALPHSFQLVPNYQDTKLILSHRKIDLIILTLSLHDFTDHAVFHFFKQHALGVPICLIGPHDPTIKYWLNYPWLLDWLPDLKELIPIQMMVLRLEKLIKKTIEKESSRLFLKVGRQFDSVEMNDIVYIKSYQPVSLIQTTNQSIRVNYKISDLERLLPQSKFMRVHKSFIVPTYKITKIESKHVLIKEIEIPLGKIYREKLFEQLFFIGSTE